MIVRTLLVDATYLFRRSVTGAKNVYTDDFGHIGGLTSFMTTIRKLIPEHSINKVVLCWDGERGGIHRYRIDKNYKANRPNKEWHKKIEMTPKQVEHEKKKRRSELKQKKRIQAYAEELFMRQIEVDEIEGDDLIAAYCHKYNNKEEIFIYSADKDFVQLLGLNVSILFPNKTIPITKRNFFTEFGYNYENSLPFKIIFGDSSDNIPGTGKMQEATFFKHFPEYRMKKTTVNEIYKKAKEMNEARIKEGKEPFGGLKNLVEGKERLKINHKLINLSEPILNDEAREELAQLDLPLSPVDRNNKNLFKLMQEDGFLSIYRGTFVNYVAPFQVIIMAEKKKFDNFNKKG